MPVMFAEQDRRRASHHRSDQNPLQISKYLPTISLAKQIYTLCAGPFMYRSFIRQSCHIISYRSHKLIASASENASLPKRGFHHGSNQNVQVRPTIIDPQVPLVHRCRRRRRRPQRRGRHNVIVLPFLGSTTVHFALDVERLFLNRILFRRPQKSVAATRG